MNNVTPIRKYDGLKMNQTPLEAQARLQELQAFVRTNMVPGVDYGIIQGTEKPTLCQPGAQKLAEIYGLAHDYEDVKCIEDWDKPLFFYRKKCIVTERATSIFVCSGVGSCNSREDRYGWRWVEKEMIPRGLDPETLQRRVAWSFRSEIPPGVDLSKLQSRERTGRNGNPYTQFLYGDEYRIPNQEIETLVNTVEKMATKRSLVAAMIAATRCAGIFTQDVEDLPAAAFGAVNTSRSWGAPESDDEEGAATVPAFERYCARIEQATTRKELDDIYRAFNADEDLSDSEKGELAARCGARAQKLGVAKTQARTAAAGERMRSRAANMRGEKAPAAPGSSPRASSVAASGWDDAPAAEHRP